MSEHNQETEAKFYVRNLERIRSSIQNLKARLIQSRVLETITRFDLPGAKLRAEGRVLRLRRDTAVRLTYKSAGTNEQGVLSREEIEFVVGDFEKAKQFLEALGFQKLVYYEKYRTTYQFEETLIMLDELPYGNFVEIEGEKIESIRAVANQLNLRWETAIGTSYQDLFERARQNMNLSFEDLSFANFKSRNVEARDLEVQVADN